MCKDKYQVVGQLAQDAGHHGQVLQVVVGLEQSVALHSRVYSVCQRLFFFLQLLTKLSIKL